MNDMNAVIIPKSDQISADDLISGPMTIRVRDVQIRPTPEQPVSIFFDGSGKAFRPCKSMSRVLVAAWGGNSKAYIGRSMTLYRDPTVKWGGLEVGGIRISHMSDLSRDMTLALTMTKGNKKPHVVRMLTVAPPAPASNPVTQMEDFQMAVDVAIQSMGNADTLDMLASIWAGLSRAVRADAGVAGAKDAAKKRLDPARAEQEALAAIEAQNEGAQ